MTTVEDLYMLLASLPMDAPVKIRGCYGSLYPVIKVEMKVNLSTKEQELIFSGDYPADEETT